ncbi:MAG: peptidylprolyl isomerase [Planctomycetia bacterium]|nr:peptidylprolyl isomerase [Planctomycetia bacterium]
MILGMVVCLIFFCLTAVEASWWSKSKNTETSTSERVSSRAEKNISYAQEVKNGKKGAEKKGFFLKWPWSKKENPGENNEMQDPFGEAKHPYSESYRAENAENNKRNENLAVAASYMPAGADAQMYSRGLPSAYTENTVYAGTPSVNTTNADDMVNRMSVRGENRKGGVSPISSYDNTVPVFDESVLGHTGISQNMVPEAAEQMEYPSVDHRLIPQNISPRVGSDVAYSEQRSSHQEVISDGMSGGVKEVNKSQARNMSGMQADSTSMAEGGIQFFEHGKQLAWVGTEVIMAADVLGEVNRRLEMFKKEIPPGEYEKTREKMIQMHLMTVIENKLLYCDIMRAIPAEGASKFREQMEKLFDTEVVPEMMREGGHVAREALEEELKKTGDSLARKKKEFVESQFGKQAILMHVPQEYDVSHAEMIDYYQRHAKEFETAPRACWEELVVRKNRFGSREEAYREMVRLGTMIEIQKVPFEQVAVKFSDGLTASDGGKNSWISPGDLASKSLENAIFSQPVGKLSSRIIEDEENFYLVRVLQREELTRMPFVDAQVEIKKKIQEQKQKEAIQEYLVQLKKEIPVRTIYDTVVSQEQLRDQKQEQQIFKKNFGY